MTTMTIAPTRTARVDVLTPNYLNTKIQEYQTVLDNLHSPTPHLLRTNTCPSEHERSILTEHTRKLQVIVEEMDALSVHAAKTMQPMHLQANIARICGHIQLHKSTHASILSPIRTIPPELLLDALSCLGEYSTPDLVRASCVCAGWRETILGSPTIWTKLLLPIWAAPEVSNGDLSFLDENDMSAELLSRSKDLPLDLLVHFVEPPRKAYSLWSAYGAMDDSVEPILLVSERIRTWKLIFDMNVMMPDVFFVNIMDDSLAYHFPLLESLSFSSDASLSDTLYMPIFDHCPILRDIQVLCPNPIPTAFLFPSPIETFIARDNEVLYQALEAYPDTLTTLIRDQFESGVGALSDTLMANGPVIPTLYEKIRRLHILDGEIDDWLTLFSFPHLEECFLEDATGFIFRTDPIISNITKIFFASCNQHLTSLYIGSAFSGTTLQAIRDILSLVPNVTTLGISEQSDHPLIFYDEMTNFMEAIPSALAVGHTNPVCLPLLEKFHFVPYFSISPWPPYLRAVRSSLIDVIATRYDSEQVLSLKKLVVDARMFKPPSETDVGLEGLAGFAKPEDVKMKEDEDEDVDEDDGNIEVVLDYAGALDFGPDPRPL
ncbi:hypothetical protein DL96DRAFT_1806607 [Flagelloscypha sp. PMI_526]|nr:hypothetical protein DL96DRAFT_1806607 [Flagelloscypha sp. PMI_526]